MTPDSARGRAPGWSMSSLFPGQFLSPIVTRSLAEVIDLTTAFVWIGAVMIVGVVGSGLAAVVIGLSSRARTGIGRWVSPNPIGLNHADPVLQ